VNLSEVKVASAAHLNQKNVKDFRNVSIIFAQFEHFRFRSDVARATSRNTVQSRKFLTFTINIHQPGGYVCLVLPWHCCAPASGPTTLPPVPSQLKKNATISLPRFSGLTGKPEPAASGLKRTQA